VAKTAFIFAGGGSLGALQVGMLRALLAHGLNADFVVGTSVGAINAAYFAGDPTIDGVKQLEKLWLGIRRQDVFAVNWQAALKFLWRRDFLLSSDGLRNLVATNLQYQSLEDARLPIHVVATDLLSGDAIVLSRGPATEAIVASCAIPAAFSPVLVNGHYLADGALTSNTPISVALELGAERLIVLPTGFACALQDPPDGAVANALHALTLLIARQLVRELELMRDAIDFAIVPTLCPRRTSPYDFSRSAELIEGAYVKTRQWIAEGGLGRREIPHSLQPHHHG